MGTEFRDLLTTLATLNGDTRRRSLRDVASLVHLSPGRAQRVFSRLAGESPGRYQQRVALDRAAARLASSNEPVIEVALASGFGSHESFTRAFGARFGVSPREYRNRLTALWSTAHRDRAAMTSPCVGLYRRPLTNQPSLQRQEPSMTEASNHSMTIKELDPTPVLFMSRRAEKDQLAQLLAEVLPAVFQYAMEQGLAMAGPPYVRYVEQSAAFFTVEGGIPLVEAPKPPDESTNIIAGELPAGPVASIIHQGPYETLGESHVALDRWLANAGHTAAGPPWEVYLTDPGEVPDPKDWKTEILLPIQPAG